MEDRSPTGGIFGLLDGLLRPVELAAASLAGAMMIAAMLLNTADALMRYALDSPLNFNLFVTENYLMVGLICLPMAWAFRTGGYIRIIFLLVTLPERMGNALLRVGLFCSAIYCGQLAWLAGKEWWDAYTTGSVDLGIVDWPWHWSWIWIPIGLGILALRLLLCSFGPPDQLQSSHPHEEDAV